MASRYWVGGTDSWNATAGTKWATTSGGAGGAAVPTSSDDVIFDANSGTGTITVSGARQAKSLTASAYAGTIATASLGTLTLSGNLTLGSGVVDATALGVIFNATASINLGGKQIKSISVATAGIIVTAQSDIDVVGSLGLSAGTFDANNFDIDCRNFTVTAGIATVLKMGSGTWTLNYDPTFSTGSAWNVDATNLTFVAGTGHVVISGPPSSTISNFYGGGVAYHSVEFRGRVKVFTGFSASALIFAAGSVVQITGGQTVTATSAAGVTMTGASGNPILFSRTGSGAATLSCASGTVAATWLQLSNITASGGATFNATNTVDGGGNSGWNITPPPTGRSFGAVLM